MHSSQTKSNAGIDLDAFREGREATIREVYVAFGETLLRDARRLVGPAEAEAVVHDVFVELLRNRELRYRFVGGDLRAWLRQIGRLKALEQLRRAGRQLAREVPDSGQSQEGKLEARDVLARFVVACVPDRQRQFFGLRFLARHTQVEISARLGIPRSTLEGWEHRITKQLRAFVFESSR